MQLSLLDIVHSEKYFIAYALRVSRQLNAQENTLRALITITEIVKQW